MCEDTHEMLREVIVSNTARLDLPWLACARHDATTRARTKKHELC